MIRALVPAKTLVEAKGRMSKALSTSERSELALAMLEDVLTVLLQVEEIADVSVVSPDNEVLTLAARMGATPIAESAHVRGINQAVNRALSAMSPVPDLLLVVLGDIPELTPDDIRELLDRTPGRGVAAAPSADGGTSALAARPPGVIPFQFGKDSFSGHREESRRQGAEFQEVRLGSLLHDIDTADDLRELLSRRPPSATKRLLERIDIASRLAAA